MNLPNVLWICDAGGVIIFYGKNSTYRQYRTWLTSGVQELKLQYSGSDFCRNYKSCRKVALFLWNQFSEHLIVKTIMLMIMASLLWNTGKKCTSGTCWRWHRLKPGSHEQFFFWQVLLQVNLFVWTTQQVFLASFALTSFTCSCEWVSRFPLTSFPWQVSLGKVLCPCERN